MQASEVDEHVKNQIQALKQTPQAQRDDIWRTFQEGFKGYTINTFKLAHYTTLRDLRNVLVSYGIPVETLKRGFSCADALQACLETKLPEEPTPPSIPQLPKPQQELAQLVYVQPQLQNQVPQQAPYSSYGQYSQQQPQLAQRPVQQSAQYSWWDGQPLQEPQTSLRSSQSELAQPRPQTQQAYQAGYSTVQQPQTAQQSWWPDLELAQQLDYDWWSGRPLQQAQQLAQQPIQQQAQQSTYLSQPSSVQAQGQYQSFVEQPQGQRSVQYDDDDSWSWPSNKQEQQETSESTAHKQTEQLDFSYGVNDNYNDDSQSGPEDWDDSYSSYGDSYSDDDYE